MHCTTLSSTATAPTGPAGVTVRRPATRSSTRRRPRRAPTPLPTRPPPSTGATTLRDSGLRRYPVVFVYQPYPSPRSPPSPDRPTLVSRRFFGVLPRSPWRQNRDDPREGYLFRSCSVTYRTVWAFPYRVGLKILSQPTLCHM